MKNERQAAILSIIRDKAIQTQDELTECLKKKGFNVTQATVSRDINSLGLVKVASEDRSAGNKKYRYAVNTSANTVSPDSIVKFKAILSGAIASTDYAGNIAVLKTFSGMANAAAAAIDAMNFEKVIGTVAGDDTIIVITRSEKDATEFISMVCETFS